VPSGKTGNDAWRTSTCANCNLEYPPPCDAVQWETIKRSADVGLAIPRNRSTICFVSLVKSKFFPTGDDESRTIYL